MDWRRLPFSEEPMGRQLALGDALLGQLALTPAPSLRWYISRPPALVLGNGQKPAIVNLTACHAAGMHVYRRTSGGAAVLANDDLLSLDLALPASHPLATTDVVEAYRWVGECWEEALHRVGATKAVTLPTEEVRGLPPLAKDDVLRLACFGTLSPWEVVIGKRKLVGLCQIRRRPGALFQVGLHLRFQPKALGALLDLNNNNRKTLGTRLHNTVVSLEEAAGGYVAPEAVITAVEDTLARRFAARFIATDWTSTALGEAARLERERYQPLT
jgi:lipoate-protein ligase A